MSTQNNLLITPAQALTLAQVPPTIPASVLQPELEALQLAKVLPLLGQAFLQQLLDEQAAGSHSPANHVLLALLRPALAFEAVARALPSLHLHVGPRGWQQVQQQGATTAQPQQVEWQAEQWMNRANYLWQATQTLLRSHAADYPLLPEQPAPTSSGGLFIPPTRTC